MSARLLQHFGVDAWVGKEEVGVAPDRFMPKPFTVPPDWSAAAFWYQIALLGPDTSVELEGLHRDGWQGDECIAELLEPFVHTAEAQQGITLTKGSVPDDVISMRNFHLQASPDLFQPLAFGMAAAGIHAHFTGLDNLTGKESDRVETVATALEILGVRCELEEHAFTIHPSELRIPQDHVFDTHGDHRMAMALAPLALKLGHITLRDPEVVGKSYPAYWDDLQRAGFVIVHH
jgi:3-phosphoshikimate 1-carboxyvinyltransferase